MFAQNAELPLTVTLYTDSYVIHGTVTSRHRRVTDILNTAAEAFIVLSDVTMDEWGSTATPVRADYAQVNLASVLFAVADEPVEPTPELRMVKIPEQAFITVPPFRVVGNIHLPPEQNMRLALGELTGRFLPVTDATFWSDTVGEAKQSAVMVAVNHARAQILAPHTDVDPWAGLDRSAVHGEDADLPPGGAILGGAPSQPAPRSQADGWDSGTPEPPARDPWGNPVAAAPAAPTPDPWAAAPSAPAAAPTTTFPSVPPSRTGLLGRVHSTSGEIDLPRPVDVGPDGWRNED
ncbi:MAG: hypothetical protein M3P84_02325 [Chloroflexota bacterium]|nr:hypothetical protein [Chloroflexota bacterium]